MGTLRDLNGRFIKRGKPQWKICLFCRKRFYKKLNKESKRQWEVKKYCSSSCFGKVQGFKKGFIPWDKGTKGIVGAWNKGKRWTPEMRKKLSGKNANNWQGGITPENERLRKTTDYAIWRVAIFTRDNYTCQNCGIRGGTLHADHIKPFSLYPELRLAIDNGRTLCFECHKQTDTYGNHAYLQLGVN